jgi:spore germination cell wall hydrolase CwlJ-like protein
MNLTLSFSAHAGAIKIPSVKYRCGKNMSRNPLTCMACNNYNEAGGEGYESMKAVSKVVLARTMFGGFKRSVCGAIYEHGEFSWTLPYIPDQRPPKTWREKVRWQNAVRAAWDAFDEGPKMNGRVFTFYHADYIRPPFWALSSNCSANRVVQRSRHIFYSCKGMPKGDLVRYRSRRMRSLASNR